MKTEKCNTKPRVENGVLFYSQYYSPRKGCAVLRESLEPDHPENLYNYLKSNGIVPEVFGVQQPMTEEEREVIGKSKVWLMQELLKAWRQIAAMEKAGF